MHSQTHKQQIGLSPSMKHPLKNHVQFILCGQNLSIIFQKKYHCGHLFLSALSFLVLSAFVCCSTYTPADAFNSEVVPHEIKPGDAFIIKVTDVNIPCPSPTAYISNKRFYFSSCGETCFIAIGVLSLKTKPGTYTINLTVGKQKKTILLVVKPALFPTLKLTLPEDKVFLSPENLKRVKKEQRKLQLLFLKVSEKLWQGNFILPLENDLSTVFGTKRIMNEKKISIHKGIDIRGKTGEKVKASNNGRVVLAKELFFGGNTLIIDHGQGIYTIYMHLSSFNVHPDAIVLKGDTIGYVGSSGRATGPHLHFGVKVLNVNTNPVSLVKLEL